MKKILLLSLVSLATLATTANAELIIQPTSPVTTIAGSVPVNVATIPTTMPTTMPSDASVERLMQVFHVTDMIDTAIAEQNKIGQVMQNIPSQTEPKGIIARKKQQKLQEVLSKYGKVFGAEMNNPERRQQMIEAYKQSAKNHYSQADVDALIGFYQTPMGQQLLQKQNQVTVDYLKSVMPVTIGKSADNLEQIFPMLEKDIKKIFE